MVNYNIILIMDYQSKISPSVYHNVWCKLDDDASLREHLHRHKALTEEETICGFAVIHFCHLTIICLLIICYKSIYE